MFKTVSGITTSYHAMYRVLDFLGHGDFTNGTQETEKDEAE